MTVAEQMIGTVFAGHYDIISCLGQGGMSVVYKATDTTEKRVVAVKVLLPGKLFDAKSLGRFQREALTASSVDHHNIVEVYAFDVLDNGRPYIVMEYLPGKSLSELIKESGSLPLTRSIDIIIQTCNALEHAHQNDVIHRDLKPSNVMILNNDDGRDLVKIVDFGIAKMLTESRSERIPLTQSGDVIGTPIYMSLEQCLGRELDARTDIYSLGCVLFEMLTGTPPFLGDTVVSLAMQQQNSKAPTLKEASLGKDFPEGLETMMVKLLASNPNDRYQSMRQVREDLLALKLTRDSNIQKHTNEASVQPRSGIAPSSLVLAVVLAACLFSSLIICWNNSQGSIKTDLPAKRADVYRRNREEISQLQAMINRNPKIEELDLAGSQLNDDELSVLQKASHLKSLNLKGSMITGNGLKYLEKLPIAALSLDGSDISDDGVKYLCKITSLRDLNLNHTKVTDKSLKYLSAMPQLCTLFLKSTQISDRGLADLCKIKTLTFLDLGKTPISDAGMIEISHLPRLQTLALREMPITKRGLEYLTHCPSLTHLGMPLSSLKDEDLTPLTKMPKLANLDLDHGLITDRGVDILDKCNHILQLRLDMCPNVTKERLTLYMHKHPGVTLFASRDDKADTTSEPSVARDPAIAAQLQALMKQSPPVHIISLFALGVTDDDLQLISRAPELWELNLGYTKVTDAGMRHLTGVPIRRLDLAGTAISDGGVRYLLQIPSLLDLNLNNTNVTDQSLDYIGSLPRLVRLTVKGTKITDEGLASVAKSKSLKMLELAYTGISDTGMRQLSRLKTLGSLGLRATRITKQGLEYLTVLPDLAWFNLPYTSIKDDDLAPLLRFPRLARLDLTHTEISDRGLDTIAKCKKLDSVGLDFCPHVTDERIARLRRELPNLHVSHNMVSTED
jgi:serine/threonine protein kinase